MRLDERKSMVFLVFRYLCRIKSVQCDKLFLEKTVIIYFKLGPFLVIRFSCNRNTSLLELYMDFPVLLSDFP